jgi:DNA-binding NarL/FixJ family response regulator
MIRIIIADDHSIVRKGIRQILLEEFTDAIIHEVSDAESLIQMILETECDIIISDISMPGRNGIESLSQIKQINPKLPILIMSIHPEDQYAIRALKAGAAGYLSKDLAPEELIIAVKKVISGKKYITPQVAEKLASIIDHDDSKPLHSFLSDREFSVFKFLASGKSISEIADSMFLSANTISTYRSRILLKMNMKNNTELTVYCIEQKLI